MRRRFFFAGAAIVLCLAVVAPSAAAYLERSHLTVVTNARKPTWKLTYLLCHASPGPLRAEISEFSYRLRAKSRTLQVWSWGRNPLPHPSERGSGSCSWYHSVTHRSRFPQRPGYVTGVTLEIFDASGQTITRAFRLHP